MTTATNSHIPHCPCPQWPGKAALIKVIHLYSLQAWLHDYLKLVWTKSQILDRVYPQWQWEWSIALGSGEKHGVDITYEFLIKIQQYKCLLFWLASKSAQTFQSLAILANSFTCRFEWFQWSCGHICVNDNMFEKLCFGVVGSIQAVLKASCSILLEYMCTTIAHRCGPGMNILSILVHHDYIHQYISTLFYCMHTKTCLRSFKILHDQNDLSARMAAY